MIVLTKYKKEGFEDMIFKYSRASEIGGDEDYKEVDINSLEELMEFIKRFDKSIIVSKDQTILIYDDWIE